MLFRSYWRELHVRENYVEIQTPLIMSRTLWETSGHWVNSYIATVTEIVNQVDSMDAV